MRNHRLSPPTWRIKGKLDVNGDLVGACKALFAVKLSAPEVARRKVIRRDPEWVELTGRIFDRDGRVCASCRSEDKLNIDHILPKSRFPDLAMDEINLRVLCWPCNSAKGTRIEIDYILE